MTKTQFWNGRTHYDCANRNSPRSGTFCNKELMTKCITQFLESDGFIINILSRYLMQLQVDIKTRVSESFLMIIEINERGR